MIEITGNKRGGVGVWLLFVTDALQNDGSRTIHHGGCVLRTRFLLILILVVAGQTSTAWAEDPPVESVEIATGDGVAAVSLGLDAQLRYALSESSSEWTSEFRLRRFRPIIGFKAFDQLQVNIVPELAGGAVELRDGVVKWLPLDGLKVEVGQFAPPFNWERDGSSDFHQFTERSVANNEFQIADGRDIGLQIDFEWDKWLDFEAGVFNGAGSNARMEPERGPLFAGRIAYAPFGSYHEVEVVPEVVDQFVLMVGAGGYWALNNGWRDWAPVGSGSSEPLIAESAADVWSATGDVHVWWNRISVHGQGYFRDVSACCDSVDFEDYSGLGWTGQVGFLILPERLMFAARYSRSQPDDSVSDATQEVAGALQIFFRQNLSKLTLEGGTIVRDEPLGADMNYGRLQYQLLL